MGASLTCGSEAIPMLLPCTCLLSMQHAPPEHSVLEG